MNRKYHYYTFSFTKLHKDYGSDHTQTFKAIDFEHALKQAIKYALWRDKNGVRVYDLDRFIKEEI